MKLNTLGFTIIALFALASCTRNVSDETKISLDLNSAISNNKVGSLTVDEIRRIVINVTASDISQPVVFFWSNPCDNGPCGVVPPQEITLQVPAGSGRLVQVLVVGKDSANQSMAFNYGEKKADLKTGSNSVEVTVLPSGSATSVEGGIAGQYVDYVSAGFGYGPTGVIDVMFSPNSVSPPIVVDSSEILNGWFSVVGITEVSLKYKVRGASGYLQYLGQDMTMDLVKNDVVTNSATRPNISIFSSPNSFWVEDSMGQPRREQNGGIHVLGFFGPGVASLTTPSVCYKETVTSNTFWALQTSGDPLDYSYTIGANEEIQRLGGGLTDYSPNMAICQNNPEKFKSVLPLDLSNLRNGKNAVAGFQGPFAQKYFMECSAYRTDLAVGCYNSMMNSIGLYWNYIPNIITSGAISGVTVFGKQYAGGCFGDCENQFRIPGSDGYRCGELSTLGFSNLGPDLSAEASNSYTGSYTIAPGSELVAIACPFKMSNGVKKYLTSGLRIHGDLSAPPPPMTGLNVSTPNDSVVDGFLAEVDTQVNQVSVHWMTVPNAVVYEVKIKNSGTSIPECEVNTNAPTSHNYPLGAGGTCGYALQNNVSNGTMLQLEIAAKNSSNQVISMGNHYFTIMRDPPVFTGISSFDCSPHPISTVQLAMQIDATNSFVGTVRVSHGAGFSQQHQVTDAVFSGGYISIPALATSIDYTVTNQPIKVEVWLRHSNNYMTPANAPYVLNYNYTWNGSTGVCTSI